MECMGYINVLGPIFSIFPDLNHVWTCSSRGGQISPVWTGFPVWSILDSGSTLFSASSNSLLVLWCQCGWVGRWGRFYQSLSEYWVLAASRVGWTLQSSAKWMLSTRSHRALPYHQPTRAEGTTLCPQLTTVPGVSLAACILSRKRAKKGFGNLERFSPA